MNATLEELQRRPRTAPLRATRATRVEIAVADDKSKTDNPDGRRINANEPHELRDWAKKFGVSEEALRTAIVQVGIEAADVERYLQDKAKR